MGRISPNNAIRVTEVGGNDVSVKLTEAGTMGLQQMVLH